MGFSRRMSLFFSILSADSYRYFVQNNILTIWLAVLAIYCMDFSINAGEAQFFSFMLERRRFH